MTPILSFLPWAFTWGPGNAASTSVVATNSKQTTIRRFTDMGGLPDSVGRAALRGAITWWSDQLVKRSPRPSIDRCVQCAHHVSFPGAQPDRLFSAEADRCRRTKSRQRWRRARGEDDVAIDVPAE